VTRDTDAERPPPHTGDERHVPEEVTMTAITLNIAFAVVGLSRMHRCGLAGRSPVVEPAMTTQEAAPLLSDFASSRVASVAWFRTHRPLRPS
jgi:hypothetical protein